MITLKVPNVLDKETLQRVLGRLDKQGLSFIMEPEGEVDEDDLIGHVIQVADLGVDFEVVVQIVEPHRFRAQAVFVFAVDPNGLMYLVQKEPYIAEAS